MIEIVERNKPALIALCRQYGVEKLDLFGSGVTRHSFLARAISTS